MTFEPGKILTAADLNAALANYVPIASLAATASGQGGSLIGLSNGETVQSFIAKLLSSSGAGIIGATGGSSVQTFINSLLSSAGAAAIGYGTVTVKDALDSALQAVVANQGAVGTLTTSVSAGGALPFEVSALSGGIGTGSGGTPGEYQLVVTGGPVGHTAFITVGNDGKIASVRVGARGIATVNTAPTYALPSGTGLTGATLPTATVSAIQAGRIFLAPNANSSATYLLGWQASGGVIAPWNVGGAQWSQYQKAGIDAAVANIPTAQAPAETGAALRFILGSRLLATWNAIRGFAPTRITLPALQTKVDDDTSTNLVDRLMTAFWGATFKDAPAEVGSVYRFRLGNRVLGTWDTIQGFFPQRMTVPATAVMSDQPAVKLADRLGGGGGVATNANYTVTSQITTGSKLQLVSVRKSDSATFNLTDGTSNASAPAITSDGANVVYWDSAANRSLYKPIEGGAGGSVLPYNVVDCWGDSLTAGNGTTIPVSYSAKHGPFPTQLAALLSGKATAVNNYGQPNEISAEISGRQNPSCLITVTGNTIPASGPVTVTAYSVDILLQGGFSGALSLTGTLAGVPGTLSGSNVAGRGTSTYTFTRAAAGASTPCPANTPFIPDNGVSSRPNIQLLTYGRNDGTSSATPILNALAASVAYQTSLEKRYLVGGVLAAIGDTLANFTTINNAISAVYGPRFVDLNAVPTTDEMTAIGFVPDNYGAYPNGHTDAADIAAGYIPTGMRAGAFDGTGTDFLHLNDFGYALWALRYYRKIRSLGWFSGLAAL